SSPAQSVDGSFQFHLLGLQQLDLAHRTAPGGKPPAGYGAWATSRTIELPFALVGRTRSITGYVNLSINKCALFPPHPPRQRIAYKLSHWTKNLARSSKPTPRMNQKHAVRLAFLCSPFDSSFHPTYSEPKGRRVTASLFLAASASSSVFPESRRCCALCGLVQPSVAVTLSSTGTEHG